MYDLPVNPLADRISGTDRVVVAVATELGLDDSLRDTLRVTVAAALRHHEALLNYFEGGGQEVLCVAEGLVPFWPEDGVVTDGIPRGGVEVLPLACHTLEHLGADRQQVLDVAPSVIEHLRSWGADRLDIAELVVLEVLESLCFADICDVG